MRKISQEKSILYLNLNVTVQNKEKMRERLKKVPRLARKKNRDYEQFFFVLLKAILCNCAPLSTPSVTPKEQVLGAILKSFQYKNIG
jgi:hypothetical protein